MVIEDQYSYNHRDYERHLTNLTNFQRSRCEYIASSQERQDTVVNDINLANEDFQELLITKKKQWSNNVFKQISDMTEPEIISGALYKVYTIKQSN